MNSILHKYKYLYVERKSLKVLLYPDLFFSYRTSVRPMAGYLHVVRRALGQLGGHGGVKGLLVQFFRANDVKTGALIGVDKYGNKYFEDSKNYFFGRHRWVLYTTEMNGKNTMWEVDSSMVPAEHRWLHCMTDNPPTTHPPEPKKFLAQVHQFNVSGSSQQYVPFPPPPRRSTSGFPPKLSEPSLLICKLWYHVLNKISIQTFMIRVALLTLNFPTGGEDWTFGLSSNI
ncbi:hypothetical protein F7725_021749 [Dissostichus mawsoni]|uniref:NADH dehydrogenase [ubiquinone] 1 alpha subcomplex subunit 12 n=1 Tax=Dissostichus mawsoni TaxID=36200 RepID=A0A7J5ZCR9_DISMA|nr:hypothetical protein F7725_021749 [Dissostichus mawsoni]